jgi:16S rRNA processing protein RimM
MDEFVKIGRTQKPHSIKGELKLFVEEIYIDDVFEVEALFLEIKGQKVPYFIEELQDAMILKLEGIETRNAAEELAHKDLYLRREDINLPDEVIASGGMYYKHLEGYTIFDEEVGKIAVIEEVAEFPQQEMAYVTYKNKTLLIPMNAKLILRIDAQAKKVFMELPDGLLDL